MRKIKEHHEIKELLPWYVNGTLDESERGLIESHLETCAECAGEIAELNLLKTSVLDLNRNVACPAEDPVADVVGEIKKEGPPTIMETIKAMISGGRWFFNMKGAFVPLVAAALLFFVFFPNTPAQGEMTFLPEDGSVELVRNRRSHDVHAFSIGEGEDFVVGWIADAPSDRVTGYRCLLKFEGTPVAVAEADLQTLKRHEFRVRFPAEELQSGRYSLEIYHLPDNSIIETYNIELTLVEVRE